MSCAIGCMHFLVCKIYEVEYNEFFKSVRPKDANSMISNLNNDQLRIFNKVKSSVEPQLSGITTESIRMLVSVCGGTVNKSLIQFALGY